MKELQDQYRDSGRNISMKDLPTIAHPLWKNLSLEEKEKYERIAKDYKGQSKDTVEGRLCSDGIALTHMLNAEREEQEKLEDAVKFVEKFVSQIESADLVAEEPIYIMCFNVLCCTDKKEYIPIEVGLIKYSIRWGIERVYQEFIDPGPVPLGYTRASKQHSEETHNIPITGFKQFCKDYSKVYNNIREIVNPQDKPISPVFCKEENLKQNQSCIDWLCMKTDATDLGTIKYYDLSYLLMELRAYVGEAFPSRALSVDLLSCHAFDYTPKSRCDFHEELDNCFCALGCCRCYSFILSDTLCELYGIECTPAHLPPRISEDDVQFEIHRPVLPPPKPVINRVNVPLKPIKQHIITTLVQKEHTELVDKDNKIIVPNVALPKTSYDLASDFPALNKTKVANPNDMRQPFTPPLVLNSSSYGFNQDKRFANLGRGRGIGRGVRM